MLSSEFREKILEFIESNITAAQLEEWLVPKLPFFLRLPDTADADAVAATELGLAELNDGIRTIEELRSLLLDVLREYRVASIRVIGQPMTSAANRTVRADFPANVLGWRLEPVSVIST